MSTDALWRQDQFTKLFTTTYSGTPSEDAQDFLFSCHKVLRTMGIVETNGVGFATFHLTGSAKTWWRDFCLVRPAGSPSLTWDQFLELFLGKFLPATQQDALRRQFERLQQGSMTVTQYENQFIDLARHAIMAMGTGSEISFQEATDGAQRIEIALAHGGIGVVLDLESCRKSAAGIPSSRSRPSGRVRVASTSSFIAFASTSSRSRTTKSQTPSILLRVKAPAFTEPGLPLLRVRVRTHTFASGSSFWTAIALLSRNGLQSRDSRVRELVTPDSG
uniref:Uncharacterized protein LOC104236761 n=1 Tax=Nicotiana sylvestris TaxID=4096 RepID=A0A1U7XDX0_NICSY|nr:PREDICTED: uncharacterized protein LOC104236761 [Nicotiana sylvestris]